MPHFLYQFIHCCYHGICRLFPYLGSCEWYKQGNIDISLLELRIFFLFPLFLNKYMLSTYWAQLFQFDYLPWWLRL